MADKKPMTGAPKQESPVVLALEKALQGGTSGAMAMGIQVTTLMWMRTIMNYQYRYGTSTTEALKTLYKQGGIPRFYRGIGPALLQGPISRFGDTAANAGVLSFLEPYNMPVAVKTGAASLTAGLWRILIMPIDALKTTLQVEGKNGISLLRTKIGSQGPFVLYHGSMAAFSATAVGHFPWFFTFNFLQGAIPYASETLHHLARNAFIGFVSSVISDSCSNSLRVIKTTRQTFPHVVSYPEVVQHVIKADGLIGLLGRGLKTRIIVNGMQGLMFSVLYEYFMEKADTRKENKRTNDRRS